MCVFGDCGEEDEEFKEYINSFYKNEEKKKEEETKYELPKDLPEVFMGNYEGTSVYSLENYLKRKKAEERIVENMISDPLYYENYYRKIAMERLQRIGLNPVDMLLGFFMYPLLMYKAYLAKWNDFKKRSDAELRNGW